MMVFIDESSEKHQRLIIAADSEGRFGLKVEEILGIRTRHFQNAWKEKKTRATIEKNQILREEYLVERLIDLDRDS
jgi:hypothetical protein